MLGPAPFSKRSGASRLDLVHLDTPSCTETIQVNLRGRVLARLIRTLCDRPRVSWQRRRPRWPSYA